MNRALLLLANSDNPFKPPYEPIDWVCVGCVGVVCAAVAFRIAYLVVKGVFF